MNTLISYSLDDDYEIYRSINYKDLNISSCTVAGNNGVFQPQKPNEDAFSVMDSENGLIAVVFDGTTSLKPIPALNTISGARYASHFLKEKLETNIKSTKPFDLIRELNRELLKKTLKFEGTDLSDTHTLPASTLTMIQIDIENKVINLCHVGDSFCILFYKNGSSECITIDKNRESDDHVLEMMRKIAEEKKVTIREARQDKEVKQALLDKFQNTRNRADGTGQGILNGDPNIEQYIQDISFTTDNIDSILLGSDGILPPGLDEQNENDRRNVLTMLSTGGLRELIRVKQEVENNDPDFNSIRFKHSDDATGIFIEFK
jgi:serine/threonine protein phosphatase PrpC